VRDALDEIIEAKVPITERCYKEVVDQVYYYVDMIVSLLQSRDLPDTICGSKPLDYIIHSFEGDVYFEEAPVEIFARSEEDSLHPK
jgi:hypothetical protein